MIPVPGFCALSHNGHGCASISVMGYLPSSDLTGLYGSWVVFLFFVFEFLRNIQIDFCVSALVCTPTKSVKGFPFLTPTPVCVEILFPDDGH